MRAERAPRGSKSHDAETITTDIIATSFGVLFEMPVMFGAGDHWRLHHAEAQMLAERAEALIATMGKRRAKKMLETANKLLAPVAFLSGVAMVTYPRYQMTREASKRVSNKSPLRVVRTDAPGRDHGPGPARNGNGSARDVPSPANSPAGTSAAAVSSDVPIRSDFFGTGDGFDE